MRNICLIDNILDDSIAKLAHESYIKVSKELGWYNPNNESQIEWKLLKPTYKWANRYLSNHYCVQLNLANKMVISKNDQLLVNDYTEKEIKLLTPSEHTRWVAERAFSGWQNGQERNNQFKIHKLMVPWEIVDEPTRLFDESIVKNIPSSIRKLKKMTNK